MTHLATLMGAGFSVASLVLGPITAKASRVQILVGPAQYSALAEVDPGTDFREDSGTVEGTFGGRGVGDFGTAEGFATTAANQRVSASGKVAEGQDGRDSNFVGTGNAILSYSFEIVLNDDPLHEAPPAPVKVGVRARGSADASGQASANGFFQLVQTTDVSGTIPAKTILNLAVCDGLGCNNGAPPSFNYDQSMTLLTNTGYLINLAANAGAINLAPGQTPFMGSGEATIDPYFFLAVLNPSDYTLVFSPGIINEPDNLAVPEPSTWAMMLLGFAGFGFAHYRASRTRVAADFRA
jgi:hypothetical protein